MRRACIAMTVLPLLAGCVGSTSSHDDDCTSHYVAVADAPTRAQLMRKLREDVDPRVRDLVVIDKHPDAGKVYVNLVSRHRNVMALEMWEQDDGTWTAQRWSQCID